MPINAPGVYFEEGAPPTPAANAARGRGAFIGRARRGRTDRAQLVRSWAEYVRMYGGFVNGDVDLGMHCWNHFRTGGGPLRVLRVCASDAAASGNTSGILKKGAAEVAFEAAAASPGAWGNTVGLSLSRDSFAVRSGQTTIDALGNTLPNSVSNAASLNVVRAPVGSIVNARVGDLVDSFSSAGAWDSGGPGLILGTDPSDRTLYISKISNTVMDGSLRTNSQHRCRTIVLESLAASATSISVDSVDGLKPGSLVTMLIFSHCTSAPARGYAQRVHAVVDRVVGRRVHFTAGTSNAATIPAKTAAARRVLMDGVNGLLFVAQVEGTGGNDISVALTAGAGATTVSVSGSVITIEMEADATLADVITAVEASASATALVSVSAVGNSSTLVETFAAAFLTGGAQLLLVSQEFRLEVLQDGVRASLHENLSIVPTSNDYIGTRLGANLDANESGLVILSGDDGVVGTGAEEVAQLPRALASISLSGGDNGATLVDTDIIGAASPRSGIYLLQEAEDIAAACAPGYTWTTLAQAGIALAESVGTFQWLIDVPVDLVSHDAIAAWRQQTLGTSNAFGQVFGPWGSAADPRPNARVNAIVQVPPTPFVTGALSQITEALGAHGSVGNVAAPYRTLTYAATPVEHGSLNAMGVCLLKAVPNVGVVIMGDRTLLDNSADVRRFGPPRRWLNYFRRSIGPALQALLFAPITGATFKRAENIVDRFLSSEWEKGALYPDTDKKKAYSVKCDAETTTTDDIAAGRLVLAVAVSPVVPAEQILFHVTATAGGISLIEA